VDDALKLDIREDACRLGVSRFIFLLLQAFEYAPFQGLAGPGLQATSAFPRDTDALC
jgi:hypothetical protein